MGKVEKASGGAGSLERPDFGGTFTETIRQGEAA